MNIQEHIKRILREEINESNFLYKAKDLIGRLLLKDKYNEKPSLSFDREFGTEISQKYNYPFGLSENKIWRVINNCNDGSEKNCILVKKIVDNLGDYFPYPDYNNLPFEKKVDILQGMVSNFNYYDIVSFSIEEKTGENNELEDEVYKLQNKLNYNIQWVPSKQTIDKIKKHMNLQEHIIRILKEEKNPSVYVKRRMQCFDEFVNKLENDELVDIPIIRNTRLNWINYKIILTAYMRAYCGESGYYDEDIHQKIMDHYGDRLHRWFKKNIE
jgi:hypothetical protein